MKNLVGRLVAYESGEMNQDEIIKFFQELVDNGVAWKLQGHYGRMADTLIDSGMVKAASHPFVKPVVESGETNLFCNKIKKDLTSE